MTHKFERIHFLKKSEYQNKGTCAVAKSSSQHGSMPETAMFTLPNRGKTIIVHKNTKCGAFTYEWLFVYMKSPTK